MALDEENYRTWLQGRPAESRPDSPFLSAAEATTTRARTRARTSQGRGGGLLHHSEQPTSHEADEVLARSRSLLEENERLRRRLRFLGLDVPESQAYDEKRNEQEGLGPPPDRAVSLARELLRRRYPGIHQAAAVMMKSDDPGAAEAAAPGLNLDGRQSSGETPDELAAQTTRSNLGRGNSASSACEGPISTALRQRASWVRDLHLTSLSEASIVETQRSLAQVLAEVEDARSRSQSFRKTRQGRASSVPDTEIMELKEQLALKRERIRELKGTIERLEKWPQDFARHEKLQTIFGQYTEKALIRDILKRWNELALWSSGKDPISYKYPVGAAADELYPLEKLKAGYLQVHVQRANGLKNVGFNVLGDLSDPYVVVRVGETLEASTETVWDNLDPVWAKSNLFTFQVAAQDYLLRFEVFSENNVQQDNSLGTVECHFRLLDTEQWIEECQELYDGTLASCGQLHYRVRFSADGPDPALTGQMVAGRLGRPDPEGPATGLSGAAARQGSDSSDESDDEEFNVWSEGEEAAEERRKQAEHIMIEEQNRMKAGNLRVRNPEAMTKAPNVRDRRNKTKAKRKGQKNEGGPAASGAVAAAAPTTAISTGQEEAATAATTVVVEAPEESGEGKGG